MSNHPGDLRRLEVELSGRVTGSDDPVGIKIYSSALGVARLLARVLMREIASTVAQPHFFGMQRSTLDIGCRYCRDGSNFCLGSQPPIDCRDGRDRSTPPKLPGSGSVTHFQLPNGEHLTDGDVIVSAPD